jgi:pyruvate formate-lyase activating enzyme-like uncharacterized protein
MDFKATKHYNFKTCKGKLAEGCTRCVKGEKLVLFITGLCGNGCSYCPVSDQKNLKDVIFANERKITTVSEAIEEGKLMRATGAGITGGDPLATLQRTCNYIKALKKSFGEDFHIHLYTPLLRVKKETLKQLYDAGLDEIRFHPKLDNNKEWNKLLVAKEFDWQVGVEIPIIPSEEKNAKLLFDFLAKNKVTSFINLNEFEYADNLVFEKSGKKYVPKNNLSYGVKGSVELGKKLLTYASKLGLAAHLCTAKSKDAVQLAKRMQRRAKNAALPFDAVDKEGLLTRGAIYDTVSIKDAGYLDKLALLTKEEKAISLKKLSVLKNKLIKEWAVPEELLYIDKERLRLLTTTSVAQALADEPIVKYTVAIVKEYPTHDCFLVQAEILYA